MNTLLAILKVKDARRKVILASELYQRFPWRHLRPPPPYPFDILYFECAHRHGGDSISGEKVPQNVSKNKLVPKNAST